MLTLVSCVAELDMILVVAGSLDLQGVKLVEKEAKLGVGTIETTKTPTRERDTEGLQK